MPSGLAEYSPQLQIIEQQTAKTRKITSSIGSDARSLLSLSEAVIESETRLQLNQCDYPQMYTCLCMVIGMVIGNDGNVEQRKDGIKLVFMGLYVQICRLGICAIQFRLKSSEVS